MTTPNEELIARLRAGAFPTGMGHWGDLHCEAADALQSQAERIAELEKELKTAQEGWRCECSTDDACRFARERDTLRAQLAEIEKTEPVAWLYTSHDGSVQAFTNEPPQRLKELCKPVFNRAIAPALRHQMSDGALIDAVANSIAEATRPMPAQDVTDQHRYTLNVLKNVKHCLEAANKMGESSPICDTIWFTPHETLFDYIDAALSKYKGAKL